MKALRTPDERFVGLPDFPYAPHYVELDGGLRMHYLDEGRGDECFCVCTASPRGATCIAR